MPDFFVSLARRTTCSSGDPPTPMAARSAASRLVSIMFASFRTGFGGVQCQTSFGILGSAARAAGFAILAQSNGSSTDQDAKQEHEKHQTVKRRHQCERGVVSHKGDELEYDVCL